MFDALLRWSLGNRPTVLVLSALIVLAGLFSLSRLSIDAFPDTTPVQVQVNADAPALSPVEIEQQIAFPIEQALGALPGLVELRSVSKFGLCQVVAVFEDGTDIWLARQWIGERLRAVELPAGIAPPELGPVATGLGEVLHYALTSETATLEELTTLHDWVIRPQLLAVPGVAEVNTWGGRRKQYHVVVEPDRLLEHDLRLSDLVDALRRNNENVGGGVVSAAGELHLVHGIGLVRDLDELASLPVAESGGTPIRVRDLGEVRLGHQIRRGAVTARGTGEIVLGLGFMRMGESSHVVTSALRERLAAAAGSLPKDVRIEFLYDRTELVDRVIATVRTNLFEGALLVVAILFVFLGNLRAGLIVALAIPLAMLVSASAMARLGIAASLLSLGAIDFGLVVDSSVIVVENCVRRLARPLGGRRVIDVVREATLEVRGPTMFGELIILIVYLPILLLEGVEGRLFRPMALTVIFALAGSLLFSLTLIPVLASYLLGPRGRKRGAPEASVEGDESGARAQDAVADQADSGADSESDDELGHDGPLVRAAQRVYRPIVRLALRFPRTIVALGALLLVLGGLVATRLGRTFVPRLYEEALVVNTVRLAGVSLDESVRYGLAIERLLLDEFPDEVRDVWSRTGTAQVATDPMGLEVTDVFVTLKPRGDWRRARTQAELTTRMQEALATLPGMRSIFTQPIEMRINEMTAGIRADIGVELFADDLEVLRAKADQIAALIEEVPGARDVAVEPFTGLPVLEIEVDRDALARHGLDAHEVLEWVRAVGELPVGEIREGQRRFDLVVRLPDAFRSDPEAVRALRVPVGGGRALPLRELAHVRQVEGPATIQRVDRRRRVVVQTGVEGRDLGGFARELRAKLDAELELPPGAYTRLGGQYQHLIRASRRLAIIVPIALAAVLFLLYTSTRSLRDALVILTGAPFAALGGIVALWLRDMPFTISAGVGFVAVCGVSMLNGLVLVSTIRRKIDHDGLGLEQAIERTRLLRLRAILMTALVAAIGFLPMALGTGVGAEVQRPLATVVIGGVLADNLLTLVVLPALYVLIGRRSRTP